MSEKEIWHTNEVDGSARVIQTVDELETHASKPPAPTKPRSPSPTKQDHLISLALKRQLELFAKETVPVMAKEVVHEVIQEVFSPTKGK